MWQWLHLKQLNNACIIACPHTFLLIIQIVLYTTFHVRCHFANFWGYDFTKHVILILASHDTVTVLACSHWPTIQQYTSPLLASTFMFYRDLPVILRYKFALVASFIFFNWCGVDDEVIHLRGHYIFTTETYINRDMWIPAQFTHNHCIYAH